MTMPSPAINALYKTELIRQHGPSRTIELATLEWMWWFDDQRLHSEPGYRTSAEFEASHDIDVEHTETATAALEKH